MKTRKFIIATIWIATAALVWSCEENNGVTPETPQESLLANNILVGSNSALNRVRGTGIGGPIGAFYGTFNNAGGRAASPLNMMRSASGARTQTDSTGTETPSCLVETWEDDGNGNYTYTLDFGDGCDYYGEFLQGKLVEKGSYTDNSFTSSATYTNFGGYDWKVDGTYSYSGTWEDQSQPATDTQDSVWMYTSSYQFAADMTQEYTDYGYPEDSTQASTGETLVTVDYVASGSETMDQDGYTVESRTESLTMSSGYSFTSNVDTPLHLDYACEDVWIYTKGVESGTYTYEGENGTYSINYGDGTCDNIITITENGVSEDVDLEDLWNDWEEECGNGDHD